MVIIQPVSQSDITKNVKEKAVRMLPHIQAALSLTITSAIRNEVYTAIGLRLPASINSIGTCMAKGEERAGELCAAALNNKDISLKKGRPEWQDRRPCH
jgi:hypothetical protein